MYTLLIDGSMGQSMVLRETSKSDPSGQWLIFDHNNNFDLRVLDPKYSELKMIVYEHQELKKENKTSWALGFSSCFISCIYLPNIHLRWNLLKFLPLEANSLQIQLLFHFGHTGTKWKSFKSPSEVQNKGRGSYDFGMLPTNTYRNKSILNKGS